MSRLWEFILGLPRGFLGREGQLSIQFNPSWPLQQYVGGAVVWNLLLILAGALLVVYVYRRETHSRTARLVLGGLRAAVLAFVLVLLNRPVLTLGQVRREPSVLALLIDDSMSMKVKDAHGPNGQPISRLDGIVQMLCGDNGQMLRKLASVHDVRIYDFARAEHALATIPGPGDSSGAATQPDAGAVASAMDALAALKPVGDGTQIVSSLRSVLEDLQGQRVAGVVVLTDGRETPTEASPDAVAAVKSYGDNIVPVAVGTDKPPRNITIEAVNYEDNAFADDLTNFDVTVRATGYEPNHPLTVQLEREITQDGRTVRVPATDESGQPIKREVVAADDKPFDVNLQFKPAQTENLVVEVTPQPDELDDQGNFRKVQLAVLDQTVSVLYVDGYPRWDYRYLKTSLLRDKTIRVSCLLTSADPTFRQEGSDDPNRPSHTWAITAFPDSLDQLLDYDVVILGDVDPREFTDAQLQLINDFVSKKGGGFEMVAGPRWSPQAFRNTPIEPVLPVIISHVEPFDSRNSSITEGFRPVLTRAGEESTIFRFFPDPAVNDEFIRNHLQELFWYCHGPIVKPGVGIVLAEHPTDLGPDGRKAPILVTGQYGAGRTIFSAIDDSWRWRYYTGESVFNTYWVQQIRYLARGRKLGQRKMTFTGDRPVYDLGKQVTLRLRVLAPDLMQQVAPPVAVDIVDDATGQPVRKLELNPVEGSNDLYSGSFTAEKPGHFTARAPRIGDQQPTVSYQVQTPQTELANPEVDVAALSRLGTEAPMTLSEAAVKLPQIRSAARLTPLESSQPLWNAPLALVVFAGLITLEWALRKMWGML